MKLHGKVWPAYTPCCEQNSIRKARRPPFPCSLLPTPTHWVDWDVWAFKLIVIVQPGSRLRQQERQQPIVACTGGSDKCAGAGVCTGSWAMYRTHSLNRTDSKTRVEAQIAKGQRPRLRMPQARRWPVSSTSCKLAMRARDCGAPPLEMNRSCPALTCAHTHKLTYNTPRRSRQLSAGAEPPARTWARATHTHARTSLARILSGQPGLAATALVAGQAGRLRPSRHLFPSSSCSALLLAQLA